MTCKFAAGNNPATVHMDKQWQTSWTTSDVWNYNFHGMNQGSLNYPLWGDQTIQIKCIYNSYIVILRDFSYNGAFLGVGTIMTLANSLVEKPSAINPSWNGHELSGPPIMSTAWSTEHCQMVATCMVGKRRAYGSIQFDCRRILCSTWGLLLGRGQTLQALLEFQEIHGVFLFAFAETGLERKGWAVFKSIHAYRLQKGTMFVSLGFSMVLLSLLLFTVLMIMVMSVAVCLSRTHGGWLYWTEESTSRYQTHTWRGGMRRRPVQPTHAHYVRVPEGYDGLMLHRGSNDPARGGVATSGSLDDHKSGNRTWWLTWWVSVCQCRKGCCPCREICSDETACPVLRNSFWKYGIHQIRDHSCCACNARTGMLLKAMETVMMRSACWCATQAGPNWWQVARTKIPWSSRKNSPANSRSRGSPTQKIKGLTDIIGWRFHESLWFYHTVGNVSDRFRYRDLYTLFPVLWLVIACIESLVRTQGHLLFILAVTVADVGKEYLGRTSLKHRLQCKVRIR